MALYLYYGKVGDGKSYHVVATEILPAVRDGRKMYVYMDGLNPRRLSQFAGRNANVVLWDNVEQVREACQIEVDDREGVGLKVDRGSLIVVDEAQMVWDSREWQKTGKQALAFFEYHRHFGLDVVLITQSPGRLDKGLVRLANECLHVKNLRFLSTFLGRRYVVNVRQSPQDREPVATLRGKFEDNVFACYRSATVVRSSAKVHGRGIRGAMLWGPAAAALALILYMRSGGIATLQGRAGEVRVTELKTGIGAPPMAPVAPVPVASATAAAVGPGQDAQSERVEEKIKAVLKGTLDRDGVKIYYLLLDGGQMRESQTLDGYELVGKL